MSFGLTNSPMTFMDLMNMVFNQFVDLFIIMFIYDILVYSKSEADHVDYLRAMFQTFKDQYLQSKFSKYEFWLDSISFLGHIVFKKYIMVESPVHDWARPTSPIEIWSFVGLAGYYQCFIEVFPYIEAPLTNLT